MIILRTLLICSSVLSFASLVAFNPVSAQVADTEVNEEAADEFGLERKTGRFSWSTGEIIGIGGEGSRVGISVEGVRNPALAARIWPLTPHKVILDEPRLISSNVPDTNSPIAGAILPNVFEHTVQGVRGSESFTNCLVGCISEYFTGSILEENGAEVIYTDTQGNRISFTEYETVVSFPDGREIRYKSGDYRRNNFGFMIKISTSGFEAVNQSVDYCAYEVFQACANLSRDRSANILSNGIGTENITDSSGQVTVLEWVSKTAKEFKRPIGANTLQIADIVEKYPTSITLPGSGSPDITITYAAHDSTADTHDDIVVSSITKHGVQAVYQTERVFPYGELTEVAAIEHAIEVAESKLTTPFQNEQRLLLADCQAQSYRRVAVLDTETQTTTYVDVPVSGGDALACNQFHSAVARQDAFNNAIASASYSQLPQRLRDPDLPGNLVGKVYRLTITRTIGSGANADVTSSFAVKPAGFFGAKRRRLMSVTDELDRKTNYLHNQFEEVGGVIAPEGNSIAETRDGRGNLISRSAFPKGSVDGSGALTTSWTYLADCSGVPLARCNKPLSMTDPKGNVTEYTYNDRGQVLTEKAPAPSSGAARPTVVNEYTERTAYIKGAGNSVVAAGPPISLLTKSFTCITSDPCTASTAAADKVVTEYNYGPLTGLNNLLLRGMSVTAYNSLGQPETLTTCYTYNYFGERIAETQPKAGLTSCP